MNKVITILTLIFPAVAYSQWFQSVDRSHELFSGWGWNRESYTNSDIHFTGSNYDFTIYNVAAKDRQTKFRPETYFGLKTVTIPQTNIRFGYFLRKNLAITFEVDHMKYVMVQNQKVEIEGHIDDPVYSSHIQNGEVVLTDDFLTFEHTDGLNYLNTELEYHHGIYHWNKFKINALGGAGFGALLPKSNVKLMGYPRNDEFHLAGFGLSTKVAVEFIIMKYFFIRLEYKTGYCNMPDIVTRKESIEDRASQEFFFAQRNGIFGFSIPLVKKNKDNKIDDAQ